LQVTLFLPVEQELNVLFKQFGRTGGFIRFEFFQVLSPLHLWNFSTDRKLIFISAGWLKRLKIFSGSGDDESLE
jgi:hypothetical protein